MADNIQVAIRVRQLLQKELNEGLTSLWAINDNTITDVQGKGQPGAHYQFDHVFDQQTITIDLYEELCKPIIDSAVAGFNGTIFAYGQSCSGKTFTMSGSNTQKGIISLAVNDIFTSINNCPEREFLFRLAYLEIYNERVYDLLATDDTVPIKIHNLDNSILLAGLTEELVSNTDQVFQCLKKGDAKRRTAETKQNDRSSRSHSILRIIMENRLVGHEDEAVMMSELNFVDLAGSEKAGENVGDRRREGCAINLSLFTLGNIIRKLSGDKNQACASFRDSKLTRILQNALGGNSKTSVICTVTPAVLEETHSTLRFASCAMTIKNKPKANEVMSDEAMLKKYKRECQRLEKTISELQLGQGESDVLIQKQNLEKELTVQNNQIERLKQMLVTAGGNTMLPSFKALKRRRETWCPGKKKFKSSRMPTIDEPEDDLFMRPAASVFNETLPAVPKRELLTSQETDLHSLVTKRRHVSFSSLSSPSPPFSESDESIGTNPAFKDVIELENDNKKLSENNQELEEELEFARLEQVMNSDLIVEFKQKLEFAEKTIAAKEQKMAAQEKSVVDRMASSSWAEEELMKVQMERNQLRREVETMKRQLSAVEDQSGITAISQQLSEANSQMSVISDDRSVMESRYEFHLNQMKEKLEMYTRLLEEKGVSPEELKHCETSSTSLQRSQSTSATCTTDQLEELKVKHATEVEKLRDEVDCYIQELECETVRRQQEVSELKDKMGEELVDQRKQLELEMTDLKEEVVVYQQLLQEFKTDGWNPRETVVQLQQLKKDMDLQKVWHTEEMEQLKIQLISDSTAVSGRTEVVDACLDQSPQKELEFDIQQQQQLEQMKEQLMEKVEEIESLKRRMELQEAEYESQLSDTRLKTSPMSMDGSDIECEDEPVGFNLRDEMLKAESDKKTAKIDSTSDAENHSSTCENESDQIKSLRMEMEIQKQGYEEEIAELIADKEMHMELLAEKPDMSGFLDESEAAEMIRSLKSELESQQESHEILSEKMSLDHADTIRQLEDKIEFLQSRIHELDRELVLVRKAEPSQLDAQQNDKSQQTDHVDQAKTVTDVQLDELLAMKEMERQHLETITELESEVCQLKDLVDTLEEWKVITAEENQPHSSLQVELELEDLRNKYTETSEELEDLRNKYTETVQELEDLRNKYTETVHEQEDLRNKYKETVHEVEDLRSKITETLHEQEDLPDKYTETVHELEDLSNKYTETVQELEDLRNKFTETVHEVEDLRSKNTETLHEQEDLLNKYTETVHEVEDLSNKYTETVQELEDLRNKFTETVHEQEDLRNKFTETVHEVEDLRSKNTETLHEQEDLLNKYTETVHEVEDLSNKYTETVQELEDLRNKFTETVHEVEDLRRKNTENLHGQEDLSNKYTETVHEQDDLPNKYTETVNGQKDLHNKYTETVQEVEDLRSKYTETLHEQEELRNKYTEMLQELDQSKSKVATLSFEVESYTELIGESKQKEHTLHTQLEAEQKKVEEHAKEITSEKAMFDHMLEDLKSEHEARAEELKSKIDSLLAELESNSENDMEDNLKRDLQIQKEKVASLEEKNLVQEEKMKELASEIGSQTSEVQKLKEEETSITVEDAQTSTVAELCKELEEQRNLYHETLEELEEQKSLLMSLQSDIDMYVELTDEHEQMKSTMETYLEEERMKVSEISGSLYSATEKIKTLEQESIDLHEKLSRVESELHSNNSSQGEAQTEFEQQKSAVANLHSELDSKAAQIVSLKEERDRLQTELDSERRKVEEHASDLTTEREMFEQLLKELTFEKEVMNQKVEELRVTLDTLGAERDAEKVVIFELQTEHQQEKETLEKKISDLTGNVETLQDLLKENETTSATNAVDLEFEQQRAKELETELETQKSEYDQRLSELEDEIKTYTELLDKTDKDSAIEESEKLCELKLEMEHMKSSCEVKLTELQADLDTYTDLVNEELKKSATLEEDKLELEKKVAKLTESLQADKNSAGELHEVIKKNEQLVETLTESRLELQTWRQDIERLKQKIELTQKEKEEQIVLLKQSQEEQEQQKIFVKNLQKERDEQIQCLEKTQQDEEEKGRLVEKLQKDVESLSSENLSLQENEYQLIKKVHPWSVKYHSNSENVEWEKKWEEFVRTEKAKRMLMMNDLKKLRREVQKEKEQREKAYDLALEKVKAEEREGTQYQEMKERWLKSEDDANMLSEELNVERKKVEQLKEKQPQAGVLLSCEDHLSQCNTKRELATARELLETRSRQFEETCSVYEEKVKQLKMDVRRMQSNDDTFVFPNQAPSQITKQTDLTDLCTASAADAEIKQLKRENTLLKGKAKSQEKVEKDNAFLKLQLKKLLRGEDIDWEMCSSSRAPLEAVQTKKKTESHPESVVPIQPETKMPDINIGESPSPAHVDLKNNAVESLQKCQQQ